MPEKNTFEDAPIFIDDFRTASVELCGASTTGTKTFNKITRRGYFYDIAQKRCVGDSLSLEEEAKIKGVPEEFIDIYHCNYFGITAQGLVLSRAALVKASEAGIVRPSNPKRYPVSQNILNIVIQNSGTVI